ncbi:MAG: hypothetical protein E7083_07715 [Bacteroidales bacterium]|nr:hypothetical protein [Bacteroidales bacterium]
MDYETKIYLEKLIEAIDSPDWWSVIVTFIAAIVAAIITYVLGKRQNKLQEQQIKLQEQQNQLQEQQIKAQEYAIYRQMYIKIDNIDTFAQTFLQKILAVLSCEFGNNYRVVQVRDLFKEAYSLNDSFTECTFDVELKQCGNAIDVGLYYRVLSEIKRLSKTLEFLLETNKINIHKYSIEYNSDYTTLINIITNCCNDKQFQEVLKMQLQECVDAINKLKTSSIKEEIKKRITSNK